MKRSPSPTSRTREMARDILAAIGGGDPRARLRQAARAYELASSIGEEELMIRALYERTRAALLMGDLRTALTAISESLAICHRSGDERRLAILTATKGEVYSQLGEYVKGVELLFEAVELAEKHGRGSDLPMYYAGIGGIYYSTGDYRKSIDFLLRSLELSDEEEARANAARLDAAGACNGIEEPGNNTATEQAIETGKGRQRAIVLCNIGNAYGHLPKSRSREMQYYQQALAIYRSIGDRRGESSVLGNIGVAYGARRNFARALEHQQLALAISEELGNEGETAIRYSQLGETYHLMENYRESIDYLGKALAIFEKLEQRRPACDIHRLLAEGYERNGDIASAFNHLRRYMELREELLNQEKQRRIAEIQMRTDIERAEREKERLMMEARQLQEELALKNRQLAATALRLVENNELLDDLQKQVEDLLNEHHVDNSAAKSLVRKIQGSKRSDASWNRFEREFTQVHPDFMRTLSQRFPSLTPTELKICALLKINLGTKEIAQLLTIAPRSVDMNRYRIRKKMELPYEMNLTTYLATM